MEPAQGFCTDVFFEKANDFIRDSAEKQVPFLAYIATNAPHGPLQAPQERIDEFSSIPDEKRRTYAAMVSIMDEQIGRLVQAISDRGELEKTLVCFLSDNGGPERANASDNGPLRGQKGEVFEGGIHVPFLMSMPGTLPSGAVYTHPVISFDLSQTALELGGATTEANTDGVNLFPYVRGEKTAAPHDALFWRMAGDSQLAVRRGKDTLDVISGEKSLFDLDSDLGETTDLAASSPSTVDELSEMFSRWNADNKPAFFPSYTRYHELLKEFHQHAQDDSRAEDQ